MTPEGAMHETNRARAEEARLKATTGNMGGGPTAGIGRDPEPVSSPRETTGESGYLSRTYSVRKGTTTVVTPSDADPRTDVVVVGALDDGRVIAEYVDNEGELFFLTGVSYEKPRPA